MSARIGTIDDVREAAAMDSAEAGEARLAIDVVGRFALRLGGREIALESRKGRALLGYLVLTPGLRESRERLIGLLWGDADEERARASLRQTIFQIRDAFAKAGFDGFRADKLTVSLDPARVASDLGDALEQAKGGAVHPALIAEDRLFDHVLSEFETIDDAYRVWLLPRRQALHDRLMNDLEAALRAPGGAARERIARAIARLDPTHEEAARALIRARAEAGDIGGALGLYKSLWDLLEEEYDVEPSRETQELIASIKLAQPFQMRPAAPAVAPPRPEAPARLILAVRGFDLSGVDPGRHYFIEGFRRELIGCLVRFREWVVRDHAGAASTRADAPGEHIVEASAFESSEGIRLLLVLRNVETQDYLWSENFNIAFDRWFEAQQSIVRRLSTALNVSLSAGRLGAAVAASHGDQIAFDLWLQAQSIIRSFDVQDWRRGIDIMKGIVERYPTFAPAYSSLAQLQNGIHMAMPGVFRDAARTESALHYARQAGRLDPIDSRSQLCLGWSHAMAKQPDLSELHMRLAYELNENDHWTLASASNCLCFCGAREEAERLEKRLLAQPVHPTPLQWAYIASNRFIAGDYDGCATAAATAGDVSITAIGFRAAALHHLGESGAARSEVRRLMHTARSRWSGDDPAEDATIARWFLHLFPIRRPDDWERLRGGFVGAGAPPVALAHNAW